MGKVLHKAFKAVANDISQVLPIMGESGLQVSYFNSDPRKLAEVTRFSDDIKRPWLKTNMK